MNIIHSILGETRASLRGTIGDLRRDLGEANKSRASLTGRVKGAERDADDERRRADALSDYLSLISTAVVGRPIPAADLLGAVKGLLAERKKHDTGIDSLTEKLVAANSRIAREQRLREEAGRDLDALRKVARDTLEAATGRGYTESGEPPPWAELPGAVARVANESRNLSSRLAAATDTNAALRTAKAELEDHVRKLRGEAEGWAEAARRADADREAIARERDDLRDAVRVARRALDAVGVPPAPAVDVAGDPVPPWVLRDDRGRVVGVTVPAGPCPLVMSAEPVGVAVVEGSP